jgi:indole-3-glycerol phosphate synthase
MKQSALLKRILSAKRSEISRAKKVKSLQVLKEELARAPACRNFIEAIRRKRAYEINLIAELKRASPSRGVMRPKLEIESMARDFERAGATALSVLTDEKFFGGTMADIQRAKRACSLPVLRKDFIIDEYQLHETRLAGADAVLIIVRLHNQKKLESLIATARNLSLVTVVEVHTATELKRALATETPVIGINTRDLGTLKIDPQIARDLRDKVPAGKIVVCESGISGKAQVNELRELRFDAMLVGEALMRSRNPVELIHEMLYP